MPTGHRDGIMDRDGLMNFRKRKSTTITSTLPPVPCWYGVGTGVQIRAKATPVCEWSTKAERAREGMNISPLFLASLPVRRRRTVSGKREETRVPSPENVPRMPWLVGNRVTCHRSRRINKLARSDEFGSILETSVSRKKWFVRIMRILFLLKKQGWPAEKFWLLIQCKRIEDVKVHIWKIKWDVWIKKQMLNISRDKLDNKKEKPIKYLLVNYFCLAAFIRQGIILQYDIWIQTEYGI